MTFVFLWLGLLNFACAEPSHLSKISSGVPVYFGRELPATSYVEVHTRRLAHARIVWVDFELLREMGIEVPPNGLTHEFEQELLDAFAFAVPRTQDTEDAFTSEEKTYYADRYGGGGLDANFGSGRAGAAGRFQSKGLGVTSLVGEHADFNHAHGGASLAEANSEAAWGKYNQKRLPFGGNRVALVIDTGTYTEWQDGGKEPRALIVRQDPLRPAHFGEVLGSKGRLSERDPARTWAAVQGIDRALPQPAGVVATTQTERINLGLKEYVRRIAQQYSTAYAMRTYHGATSPSNMEVTGRFIDYGTQTTQPGYGFVQTLPDNDPFGKTGEFKTWLIRDLMVSVRKYLEPQLADSLLTDVELFSLFDAQYEEQQRQELAALTGIPPELAARLKNESSALQFRELFREVAEAGATIIDIDKNIPEKVSTYNVPELLTRLAAGQGIEAELADAGLRERFSHAYGQLMTDARALAQRDGVSAQGFAKFVAQSARLRNQVEAEFFRPAMRWENAEIVKKYKLTGNRSLIWNSIDEQVDAGDLHLDDVRPYQLVLSEQLNRITGVRYRHVFDARENLTKILFRLPPLSVGTADRYAFEDQLLSRRQLEEARVIYSNSHRKISGQTRLTFRPDGTAEFEIPGSHLDFVLRWRQGGKRVKLSFPANAATAHCEKLLQN